jgi:hypothetical protein
MFQKKKPSAKTIPVRFIVVDCPSTYNAIIVRSTLNSLGAIVSTIHFAMKYPGENGVVVTVHEKSSDARRCYQKSLKITKTSSVMPKAHGEKGKKKMERQDLSRDEGVMMKNLDPWVDFECHRPQPEGDQILV